MGKKFTNFEYSALQNKAAFSDYFRDLAELAMSSFTYDNLPETVNADFLELQLFTKGAALFFRDEVTGEAVLPFNGMRLDIYGEPIERRAYSVSGYQRLFTNTDSVIIWNNKIHGPSIRLAAMYARRLYDLDQIIDVNARAQKTPVLIQSDEKQRLTLKNVYMQWDGNQPVIYGDKNLDLSGIKVLKTEAPFVSDKVFTLKVNLWNEALTKLGIPNVSNEKRERLNSAEVYGALGGTAILQNSRLDSRRRALDKINKMFGTNISVSYVSELYTPDPVNESKEESADE